jgi:hypothetical protein
MYHLATLTPASFISPSGNEGRRKKCWKVSHVCRKRKEDQGWKKGKPQKMERIDFDLR